MKLDKLQEAYDEMFDFITDLPSGLDGFESDFDAAYKELLEAKSADDASVVCGQWIDIYGCFETAECSRCHSRFEVTFDEEANGALWDGFNQFYRFCPNCGAKMGLEE